MFTRLDNFRKDEGPILDNLILKDQKVDLPRWLDTSSEIRNLDKPLYEKLESTEARELTEEERQELKEKTGWSDDQLKKCTIKEDGTICYRCDNKHLEGKVHESSGVEYIKKTVEINGVKVEVVVPNFDSAFDAQLPKELQTESNSKQFRECNNQLKEAVSNNDELKSQFTDEQLEDINDGQTPEGYTWHHNEEVGKMELVKTEDHDRTQGGAAHTGGKALWGGSYN